MPSMRYVIICARTSTYDATCWSGIRAYLRRRRCHYCPAEIWYNTLAGPDPEVYGHRVELVLVCRLCVTPQMLQRVIDQRELWFVRPAAHNFAPFFSMLGQS